ncbi:MAG: hypothetical protein HC788_05685 [Sphingopyxis sp.]|nr:hypothetical protein [Sphingopyxis sp.]
MKSALPPIWLMKSPNPACACAAAFVAAMIALTPASREIALVLLVTISPPI